MRPAPTVPALLLGLSFATACGAVDDGNAGDETRLRVVHVSPDAPAVDIHIEGSTLPLISNLAYGDVSEFVVVDAGTVNLQVRPTGRLDEPLYETGPLTLEVGADITGVATGFLESTEPSDAFRLLALRDDFADAGTGVRARIVHASPDAPTVGIDVGNDTPNQPEVPSLARFSDSGATGVELPADAPLAIGLAAGGDTVTAFETPALPPGSEVLVLAAGRLGAEPDAADALQLLVVDGEGLVAGIRQNPIVYAVHQISDLDAVDVTVGVGGPVLLAALPPDQIAGVRVPPGSYQLGLSTVATGGLALGEEVTLAAGERYLAVAAGFVTPASAAQKPVTLIATTAPSIAASTDARLRFVHAAGDAPSVDFGGLTAGGTMVPTAELLTENLRFGEASASPGASLPEATQVVAVAPAGAPTPLASYDLPGGAGQRGFVITTGALNPQPDDRAYALFYVDTTVSPWTATVVPPRL